MSQPLIDVTGRRRRRARERLRHRLLVAGSVLGVLAVLGGLGWLVTGSPAFVVRTVAVTGTSLTPAEDVRIAAGVPAGVPLAQVDTAAVAARVAMLPAVARAEVVRSWPSSLTITVTEREVRLVRRNGSGYQWLDATGRGFHASAKPPKGAVLADVPGDDAGLLAAVAAVADSLPPALRERTEVVKARSADSIVLELSGRGEVNWGSAEQSVLKSEVVVPLLALDARVYDVSAPTHPTTRG